MILRIINFNESFCYNQSSIWLMNSHSCRKNSPKQEETLSRTELVTKVRPCGSKAPLFAPGNEQSRRVDAWTARHRDGPDIRTTDGRTDKGGCQEQKDGTGEIRQLEWQLQCNLGFLFDSHPQQPLTAIHYSPANEDINIPAAGERQDVVFYLTALKEHRLHQGSACEFSIVLNINVIVVSLNGGCIHMYSKVWHNRNKRTNPYCEGW